MCANDRFARSIDRAARSMDLSLAQASVDRATIDRSRSAICGSVAGFVGGAMPDVQLVFRHFLRMFMI